MMSVSFRVPQPCRTPQGVRGLKSIYDFAESVTGTSHPARGAWIEINYPPTKNARNYSRTPQGVRGLKSRSRTPCRGIRESHPARGAWIEIETDCRNRLRGKSHPARGAWIEIKTLFQRYSHALSRTPQGVRGLKYPEQEEYFGE